MFRAYDAEREHLVAVKLFKLDIAPDAAHRIVAEFERVIAAELWHPALVLPETTGVTGVDAYVATDYVAADSLDAIVRERGPLAPLDAIRMAHDIGGALDVAAVEDVLHGALHPRDVLIASDETRFTGLAVAQALAAAEVAAPIRRPYTAPERIADEEWDRRADVFSLAAIVYEALFGRRIAGAGNLSGTDLPDVPGVDRDRLRRALNEALAENPARRTPTAGHFVEALKRAVSDSASSMPTPHRPRARKPRAEAEPPPAGDLPLMLASEAEMPLEPAREAPRFADIDLSPPDPEPPPAVAAGPSEIDEEPPAPAPTAAPIAIDEIVEEIPLPPPPAPVPVAASAGPLFGSAPEPPVAAQLPQVESTLLERSRSAVWPLLLAMVIGVALGFAGGYAVAMRDHPAAQLAGIGAEATGGREFTDTAIGDSKPAPPAAVPSAAAPSTTGAVAPAPATAPSPKAVPSSAARGAAGAAARVPPTAAPTDKIGRLFVRATPVDARVLVDGKDVGRVPASARDLAVGPHRVRVSRDGYTAAERQVVITRERPTQTLTVALDRVRAAAPPARAANPPPAATGTGSLMVESRPPGAKVFLDGTLIGMTPLTLPKVNAGNHMIRLERDGFRNWAASTRVSPGQRSRVAASLDR